MAPVALAWTLTLLRCFHSSAHSRSVSLWSITSSGRDPWTAAGGEWTLRPHLMLLGLTPSSPSPGACSVGSYKGCTHLGKVERVKKASPGTDPLPTAHCPEEVRNIPGLCLRLGRKRLTSGFATLPAPPCLQNLLLSCFLSSAAKQGCIRPHFWGLTTAQKPSGPPCDCLAPTQALPLSRSQLDSYVSARAQVTGHLLLSSPGPWPALCISGCLVIVGASLFVLSSPSPQQFASPQGRAGMSHSPLCSWAELWPNKGSSLSAGSQVSWSKCGLLGGREVGEASNPDAHSPWGQGPSSCLSGPQFPCPAYLRGCEKTSRRHAGGESPGTSRLCAFSLLSLH